MQYLITAFDKALGRATVQFVSSVDGTVLLETPIDIPVVNGSYIAGDALEALIQTRAPQMLEDRKKALAVAPDSSPIEALIKPALPKPVGSIPSLTSSV